MQQIKKIMNENLGFLSAKNAIKDELQNYLDSFFEAKKQERWKSNYSIGNFIDDLKKFDPKAHISIPPFNLYPTGFDSYRGYYSDLALEYDTENKFITVGELLKKAEDCIGKTFTGYKGGEFTMTKDTTLWIGNYGETTDLLITGIKDTFGNGSYLEITYRIKNN